MIENYSLITKNYRHNFFNELINDLNSIFDGNIKPNDSLKKTSKENNIKNNSLNKYDNVKKIKKSMNVIILKYIIKN